MKKNGKVLLLIGIGLVMCIISWIVKVGAYQDGLFVSSGITRIGFFDYFIILYYAFYYKVGDILFILSVGGLYGVLSQTDGYRKLVSKASKLIGGYEHIAMLIITFVMGAYTSIAGDVLPQFLLVPFIVTIFLKRGKDKISALCAALGGIFIGTFGLTFGTYGVGEMLTAMGLTVKDGLVFKIITFIFAYGLFNLFAILRMNKQDVVNDLKDDVFATKKLDETGVSRRKQKKVWPTIVVLSVLLVITLLAYINWNTSFGIKFFDDLLVKMNNVKLADISIIPSVLGSFEAFGSWKDMLPLSFVVVVASLVIALVNKVSLFTWMENFGDGMKKIGKVAVMYALCSTIFIITYYFNWPATFINWLFGSGSFNVFSLLIIAIIIATLFVDPEFAGYFFGTYLTATFANKLIPTELIMHLGSAFAMILVPSSCILMMGLSYLNITYKDWMKHIWKFACSMFVVVLIALAIMCNI